MLRFGVSFYPISPIPPTASVTLPLLADEQGKKTEHAKKALNMF